MNMPMDPEVSRKAFLSKVDVTASFQLAQKMEIYKTNAALGYRTAGSQAEFLTGEMLYDEMLRIGLEHVTKDEVMVDGWDFEKARLSFTDGAGRHHRFELGGYQCAFDTEGPRDYELVYARRGTAADLENLDLTGKLVIVDINQRDEWWINYPVLQAHLKGAAAVLAVQDNGYATVDTAALNAQDICGPPYAAAFSISQADAAILRASLQTKPQPQSLRVTFDAKSTVLPNAKTYNIVGRIPGKDPRSAILLSAHYDSYFDGFQDDNAAVAMMLGIAKALKASRYEPQKTLIFCALAAEEWGMSNSRYDWSAGAYGQVFRARPDWAGKVVANLNFELPAHAHHAQDIIRCVYEYHRYLAEFSGSVAVPVEAYPEGLTVISPVQTWSDDFSIAIGGIPSMVNDFGSGHFMETHYHSQFDTHDAYHEAVYRFHHGLYGQLLLTLDHLAVPPLDFSTRLMALQSSLEPPLINECGANEEALEEAIDQGLSAADKAFEKSSEVNRQYQSALQKGDQAALRRLGETAKSMSRQLLAAFKYAEDHFVRLNWEDEAVFPHEPLQTNLLNLKGALRALDDDDIGHALDKHLHRIDDNWYAYAFDDTVCRYFRDYVLLQPAERLLWGAGRIMGHTELYDVIRSLKAKQQAAEHNEAVDTGNEVAALEAAEERLLDQLNDVIHEELQQIRYLTALLRSAAETL